MKNRRAPFAASWRTWTAAYVSFALVLTLCPPGTARASDDASSQLPTTNAVEASDPESTSEQPDYSLEQNTSLDGEQPFGLTPNEAGLPEEEPQANEPLDTTVDPSGLQNESQTDQTGDPLATPTDDFAIELGDPTSDLEDDIVMEENPLVVVEDQDDLAVEVQDTTVLYSGYCGNTENGASGKNIAWKLYSNGTLTLKGTGSTDFFSHEEFWFGSPIWPGWHDYADQITKVSIGEGITELSGGVLANLPNITSVKMPSTMKKLNQCVFFNCPNLTSVTLNDGLTSIGVDVFENSGVTRLTVPASLSYMNYSNFDEIPLDNLTIQGPNAKLSIVDGVLFGNGGKSLLFYSRDKQGAYSVPSGVTEIADCAFEDCQGLEGITLPNTLTTIGEGAFWLSGISSSFTIPNSVTTIGRQAFGGMVNPIPKVVVGSGVKEPNWYMFSHSEGIQSIELANGPTHLGEGALADCIGLTKVYFPNSIKTLEENTCNGCTSLTSVRISPNTKTIGKAAFANCTSLAKIAIPKSVTTIEEGAFYNTALTSVTLPSTVTSIGVNAFPAGCKVNIPSTLIHMDDGAYVGSGKATALQYSVTYQQTTARSMLTMLNSFRTGSQAWWYASDGSKHTEPSLGKLKYDYALEKAAMVRAREIALLFSHTRPDGRDCFSAITGSYTTNGENIAAGVTTAKSAMEMWKETDYNYYGQGHRRNMLSPDFNAVGIGHAVVNGTHYWVQVFGYADKPNANKTAAVDSKKTVSTTIYNSAISSVSSVTPSAKSLLIKKSGDKIRLPAITGKGVVLTKGGDYTWGSFSSKATVTWTSSNPSVVKIVGSKAKAVAKYGEAILKATAFGKTVKVKAYVGVAGNVSKLSVKVGNKKYTGSAIKPKPTLKLNGKKLKLGTDYTLSYKNNKKVGTASIIIKGKGHYVGSKTVRFKIVK